MHSNLYIFSLHSKKFFGGLDSFPGCRLGCDTAVDLAVFRLFRLGEQMFMARMLGALLGHLVDLHILGETRLPVEQVEMLVLGVWGNWGNSLSHTAVGLVRNLVLDLRFLVRIHVLGLAETLGLEKRGCLGPHHLH